VFEKGEFYYISEKSTDTHVTLQRCYECNLKVFTVFTILVRYLTRCYGYNIFWLGAFTLISSS
jgi:hypothetical protein